jgi:hypothetical protein
VTLNNAAWAIDGATIDSALARTESHANSSGNEGVITRGALKVSPLDVNGNGVKIAAGSALVLNRYQATPNQMYTIANDGVETVPSAEMPPAAASEQTFIVAIAVGDPDPAFSQTGHPYMTGSGVPAGQEATFRYVRAIVVLESDFNSRAYPAVPLARLVRPASTTTITAAMLTDIREIARPRRSTEVANVVGPGSDNPLNGAGGTPGAYERFPNVPILSVKVPEWAVKAKIMGYIEGLKLTKAGDAKLRVSVEGSALNTPYTDVDENAAGTGNERRAYNVGGEIDVTSVAGQNKVFSVYGTPVATADKGALVADARTSVGLFIQFEERPI